MRSSSVCPDGVCPAVTPRAVCVVMLDCAPLELNAPRERYSGRAFHPNVFAGSWPRDLELAARQFHFHGGIEPSVSSADRDSGAGAGSAGQCFSHATLEDAQLDVCAIDDFHEADVHTLR